MNRCTALVLAFLTVPALVFAGCEMEDGDSNITKKDLCLKLANAFCARQSKLDCGYDECKTENNAECASLFAADCPATSDQIVDIDHVIKNIINDKTTCDGLMGLESYLLNTVTTLHSGPCKTSGSAGSETSLGYLCEALANATCSKVTNLGCTDMSTAACANALLDAGALTIGSHTCKDMTNTTSASSAQKSEHDMTMSQINEATTCAQFGF